MKLGVNLPAKPISYPKIVETSLQQEYETPQLYTEWESLAQ